MDGWEKKKKKKAGPSHSDYCASRNSSLQLKSGGGRISQIILCSAVISMLITDVMLISLL